MPLLRAPCVTCTINSVPTGKAIKKVRLSSLDAPTDAFAPDANEGRGSPTGVRKYATPTPPRGGPGVQAVN